MLTLHGRSQSPLKSELLPVNTWSQQARRAYFASSHSVLTVVVLLAPVSRQMHDRHAERLEESSNPQLRDS